MKNWKRSVFFWVLSLLFLITAPLVVLNARGYRFDSKRHIFVYSGTISFKSNPQTVDVKLNNVLTPSKSLNRINSSFNLTGLIPNDYAIEISAPDFQTWTKKTDVHSGVSSEFWNILLVRKNYDRIDHNTDGTEKFFTSPLNRYIASTITTGQDLAVKIFNINTEATDAVFSFSGWHFIGDNKKENIEWSPDGTLASIPVEKTIETAPVKNKAGQTAAGTNDEPQIIYNYFIADPANNSNFNLNQFLGRDNISNVRWDPSQKGYLFFLDSQQLFRVNTQNASDIIQIAGNVSIYDLSRSGVYYAQTPNNLVFKKSLDGSSDASQLTNNFPDSGDSSVTKLIVYDDDRIAFLTEQGDFYIYNKGEHNTYFKKLEDGIIGVSFSNDGKKLLFWNDYEISVYYLRDWTVQPVRAEDETQSITRYSEPLKNVQWFKDYEHIIFSTGKYTKIIELDPRDHRNTMDLVATTIDSPFVIYNNFLEKLFFTDTKGDSTGLYSINFPEKVPLLGIPGLGG
jgi:hypothetical protein